MAECSAVSAVDGASGVHTRECAAERMRYGLLLAGILALLYGLLQNGYYAPGNDSSVYLAVARNILAGRGYVYQGGAVAQYPPGWPLALAFLLSVSSSFWWLNLVLKAMVLASALLYYGLMSRLTTPKKAFLCVLIAALLGDWLRYTYVLGSESLFLLLLAGTLVLALPPQQGRLPWWRVAVVPALAAGFVAVRWLGAMAVPAVAALVLTGEFLPRMNRRWLCAVLTVGVSFVAFVVLYRDPGVVVPRLDSAPNAHPTIHVEPTEQPQPKPKPAGTTASEPKRKSAKPRVEATPVGKQPVRPASGAVGRATRHVSVLGGAALGYYLERAATGGEWIVRMLWPPAQVASILKPVKVALNVFGWALWFFIAVFAIAQARRRNWVYLGIMLYMAVPITRWARPNGRYPSVFGPLFILALWQGILLTYGWVAERRTWKLWALAKRSTLAALLASVIVSNVTLYGIALCVMRSPDFYGTFTAGQCQELLPVAHYLLTDASAAGRVAVNRYWRNLGNRYDNQYAAAFLAAIADRRCVATPGKLGENGPNKELAEWAAGNNLRYFVYRPPASPWRIWHFRVGWLQRRMEKLPQVPERPSWEFYRLSKGAWRRMEPPPVEDWPRVLPMHPRWSLFGDQRPDEQKEAAHISHGSKG